MTARSEILSAAREFDATSPDGTFSLKEMVKHLAAEGSLYAEATIRTHVASVMCTNAPGNHASTYNDLVRVGRGRYRLADHDASSLL